MLAKKELQGRALQGTSKVGTTYAPRSTPSSGLTRPSSFQAPPPMSKRPTDAGVAALPKPSDSGKKSFQVPAGVSFVASTGRTTGIQCHRCLGFSHVRKDCPSQQAYMATYDGYISTSDMEDDAAKDATAEDIDVLGSEDTVAFRSIIVHRVHSTQLQQLEKLQHHNLFQTFFVINNRRACVIIDGCSSNNLVSSDLVKKLGLTTRPHPHPYHLMWFNDAGKAKVIHTCRVSFSIGFYAKSVDCDVVPMEACSILLCHPWEFDNDATHHGQSNTYTFMHKGKKLTLLPLTPADNVQANKERVASLNDTNSENQQVAKSLYPPKKDKEIKLKGGVMLARKFLVLLSLVSKILIGCSL
jgi:hypothetical protein